MARRKFLRTLLMGDTHCGHNVGLTPPRHWADPDANPKLARIQRELWGFFSNTVKRLQPIDRLIFNGDAIDGKGARSGGSEQITTDRTVQCEMAAECINFVKAKKVLMLYGTPYHVGKDEDWEYLVAKQVKNLIKIGGHEWPVINGLVFDVKHKIGSSSIPHGRMTALARAKMWNQIWHAEHEKQPKADVFIRSHVHYHVECSGDGWRAMTLPALQGYGSNFGARECEGIVEIGMVKFDVFENGEYTWKPILAKLAQQKAQTLPF